MAISLQDICVYVKGKVPVNDLTNENYISTENMLPNKAGITTATTLPTTLKTQIYQKNDILISNIRPYFKKIWYANKDGGCSNDVLVIRAKDGIYSKFLYYVLADDTFFEYSMVTSKGTKMPRGDKTSIMSYVVPDCDLVTQQCIASILSVLDDKIELNNRINENLEEQAQAIFKSWFVDFEPFGGVMPNDWSNTTLGEVSDMGAGGDKPKNATSISTDDNTIPIYSNGLTDEGLYGFTNEAKIKEESVTVSARGTIGFVCLRQEPYVPIVRLITLIPKKEMVSAKYLYHWLKILHIAGTGTTQQQLTVPSFKKTEIIVPDYLTMEQFTTTVNPFYTQILANKTENQRLSFLRDTLLPKLMNGEIDVSKIKI